MVHEQTVRLGLGNRALARMATRVAVSSESTLQFLPEAARATAVVTGNPVRPEVLTGQGDKAIHALGLWGFDRSRPTVHVTGGAQGSQQINELVSEILPWLLGHANVVHQCGPSHEERLRERAAVLPEHLRSRYLVTGFVGPELPDVLALADVVISRSGAGTLAELTALGRAAVFIPLATSAGNEQEHNARHLADAGAAVALLGRPAPDTLQDAIGPLLTDPARRADIARRAAGHGPAGRRRPSRGRVAVGSGPLDEPSARDASTRRRRATRPAPAGQAASYLAAVFGVFGQEGTPNHFRPNEVLLEPEQGSAAPHGRWCQDGSPYWRPRPLVPM
ncbi:hypothetical protein GCM10010502_53050 [Kitasatospora aureofaciens]|uniref:Glycosyl transferase family 28 C-terminal domain-containing protein n=1 Tax=Kitasatospora aureofaciens TaxID=1894 RepID=A0A8H9HXQ9_KITAU|nr:hypothetical protein GCM10010502_53050 [Kitasatospora aureofaciens]